MPLLWRTFDPFSQNLFQITFKLVLTKIVLLISYLQTFLRNSFKIIIWQYENHFILSSF